MNKKVLETNKTSPQYEIATKLITHYSIAKRPPLKPEEIKKIQEAIKNSGSLKMG